METINKYKYSKTETYTNRNGATFYKNIEGSESFYHICDNIQPRYMPEIFIHDIHASLYLDDKYIRITYCPICGKKLV